MKKKYSGLRPYENIVQYIHGEGGGAFEGKPTPGSVKIFGFQEVLRPELVLSSPLGKTNIISTHVQNPVYAPVLQKLVYRLKIRTTEGNC